MDLKNFFEPKSIALIGASRNPRKAGHIILRNFVEQRYPAKLYVINPNADEILGQKTFSSVKQIPEIVDLAVISTPAPTVYSILEECASKKITNFIIVSAGFSETGNTEEEQKLKDLIKKKNLNVVGPNCLGIFDAYSNFDSLFNPRERMDRPPQGGISLVCQSGAIGAIMLDMMGKENYGLRRFVSYGNSINIDESDFIEYLGKDEKTKVIGLYIEGVKDGKKFLDVCKRVSKKKPIIAIKAGLSKKGSEAVKSHTGSLAGSGEIYKGVFNQANIINAKTIEELFDYARMLEKAKEPKGNKVLIVTNGGGPGVLTVDELSDTNLELAELSEETKKQLKDKFPATVNIKNPFDLVGDANDEGYKTIIEAGVKDSGVNFIFVILLPQTPAISINIIKVLKNIYDTSQKPMCLVVPGGSFAETMKREFEEHIPSFSFPVNAVLSVNELVNYYKNKNSVKKRKRSKNK